MGKDARFVARGGLLTAAGVVLLCLASVSPTGQIGLVAAAGVLPAAPMAVRRVRLGGMVYAATAVLGLIVAPSKGMALAYTLFFGLYTLVKYGVERLRKLPLEWALKLLFCNVGALIAFFILRQGFLPGLRALAGGRLVLLVLITNVVFIAYDIAFSRLIGLLRRIFPT